MLGLSFLTVEAVMFFGIGFLAASLIGVLVVAAAQARAVRLTTRRLDAQVPPSVVQMQAEKDHLRAEFATSTKKLERSVEELREKVAAYSEQIAKKSQLIDQSRSAIELKVAMIDALERREAVANAREKELFDQLQAAKAEILAATEDVLRRQRTIDTLNGEITALLANVDQRDRTIQLQQNEQQTLKDQIEAFRRHIATFAQNVSDTEVQFHSKPAVNISLVPENQSGHDGQPDDTNRGGNGFGRPIRSRA
jgi:chromosome segregation ATPase